MPALHVTDDCDHWLFVHEIVPPNGLLGVNPWLHVRVDVVPPPCVVGADHVPPWTNGTGAVHGATVETHCACEIAHRLFVHVRVVAWGGAAW